MGEALYRRQRHFRPRPALEVFFYRTKRFPPRPLAGDKIRFQSRKRFGRWVQKEALRLGLIKSPGRPVEQTKRFTCSHQKTQAKDFPGAPAGSASGPVGWKNEALRRRLNDRSALPGWPFNRQNGKIGSWRVKGEDSLPTKRFLPRKPVTGERFNPKG